MSGCGFTREVVRLLRRAGGRERLDLSINSLVLLFFSYYFIYLF